MTDSKLLILDGISVEIAGREVVRNISFDIAEGEAFALVGESGSGKTITARAVTGLLGRIGAEITSGTLTYGGTRLDQDSREWTAMRGKRVALVPQASLSSLDPVMRVGHQLRETVRFLDPTSKVDERVRDLLEQVRMPKVETTLRAFPHELSGGMRQRVAIALALAGRPELIVADEPTTALDVTVQAGILRLLSDLRRENGMSLLLIAHDLAVVNQIADRVAVMRTGQIIEMGPAERVLSKPSEPYTRALLAARPESAAPGAPLAILDRATGELRTPAAPERVVPDPSLIVALTDVSVTYRGARAPSLAPVSLDIHAGDSVGIVGESGSGKTTLGRVIVGALPPTSGRVEIDGMQWSRVHRSDARRREVQMIFQDPFGSLTPWRTPREIVAEVARTWFPQSQKSALSAAGDLLDEVGLPAQAMDRRPAGLSGGQCQRVGIARALACRPRVIVADEPTSALDVSAQAQILNLLMDLRASRGLAIALISHDLSVVRHMVDRALVMRHGAVVESGSVEDIFHNPRDRYTQELLLATPRLGRAAS